MTIPTKNLFENAMIFLLIVLILFGFIGIVNGEEELSFNKDGNPVFTLRNESLINSFNASYFLGNKIIERPFSQLSDEKLFLAYIIVGKKYLGNKVNTGGSCLPTIFAYEDDYAAPSICMDVWTASPNSGVIIPETLIYYSTTIPEIDEYMNSPSYETEILVNYSIKDPKITRVAPITLNLGKWPVSVNEEKITDVFNKPIKNDTILIFGSNTSMILNKGDTNIVGLSLVAGSENYTGSTRLISIPRNNPDFSYLFYEYRDNYFLRIERTTQIQEGILSLTFRPIKIVFAINIEDPIVENTLNFLDKSPDRLKFKPNLQINISNSNIRQLNFKFLSNGNTKISNISLDQNGTYSFSQYLDANGNSFFYPFDHYTSNIEVNPPLLISNQEEIPTQSNSGFNAIIKINYKTISFDLSRSIESLIGFFCGLLLILIGIIALFIKPGKNSVLFLSIFGVIVSIISLFNTNGFNRIFSIGTIIIISSILIIIVIYYKFSQKQLSLKNENNKNKK
jgi:hypothetical protein